MDIALLIIAFIFMVIAVFGSFLPVIPGPPLSWIGLLLLYLTKPIAMDYWVLGITLGIAIVVTIMDYWIPALGTKKFGGSRAGMIGTLLGLMIAVAFPFVLGIFGIIVWPFFGAMVGELINQTPRKKALRAAFGSFLGFLTGTFLKFVLTLSFFAFFTIKVWEYKRELLPFLFREGGLQFW